VVALPGELRFAIRTLRKSPGFAAVAVGTLALGIAATAAIFSVIRGVLLEPLPYPDSEHIVQLWQIGDQGQEMRWSEPNFRDLRERNRSLAAMAAYANGDVTVTGAGEAARIAGAQVSEDFFTVLGIRPERGRGFLPEDFRSAAPVVIVSHGYWQGPLGGDPGVLGRSLRLGDQAYTVVGVLPPRMGFPAEADLWVPRSVPADPSRTAHNWSAIGRLAGAVPLRQAREDLRAIAVRLKEQYGDDTWMAGATAVPLHEELVGPVRPALLILLGAAGLLLLIACANVANLLLARATTRRRELAVRLALGAGHGRLLQQVLTESAVLALTAGVIGVFLARWGVDALLAFEPGHLPRLETVGVDWRVVAFALVVSSAAALGIGLAATFRAARTDVREALTEGGRAGTGGDAGRLRGALVAVQVAFTLVLLVGAGLLGRSFLRLITLDPGYRTGGALAVEVTLPGASGESDDPLVLGTPNRRGAAVLEDLRARLAALPGVSHVGGINAFPLTGGGADGMFLVLERPDEVHTFDDWGRLSKLPGRSGYAEYRIATPGYFPAMEIPLVRGRLFDERDGPGSPHVAVISESLAETQWPGEDPLGRLIQFGNMDGDLHALTVVGVVGDVRDRTLEAPPRPTLYANALQRTTRLGGRFDLVLAGMDRPATMIPAVRAVVRDRTPDGPVRLRTLDAIFAASLAERRFGLLLLGVFGATALLLAALGISAWRSVRDRAACCD
jgi:predicted permease